MIATEDLLWRGKERFKRLAREQEKTRISVPIKLGQGQCWNGCCYTAVWKSSRPITSIWLLLPHDSMSGNFRTVAGIPAVTSTRRLVPAEADHAGRDNRDALALLINKIDSL